MMTEEDKAKELVERFSNITRPMSRNNTLEIHIHPEHAKQSALLCVDEIISCTPSVNGRPPNYQDINKGTKEYWQEVKQKINKL